MLRLIYCYPGEEEIMTDPVADKVAAAMEVSPWVGFFDVSQLEGDPHQMIQKVPEGGIPETYVPGGSLYMGNPRVHLSNDEVLARSDAQLTPEQRALET